MTFPGDKLVLGSYCGPSIDVGPALTSKILRNNGQQVHRYTYRALTPYELVNPDEIKACDEFDMTIEDKLGPAAISRTVPPIGHAHMYCDPILIQTRGISVPTHHTEHTYSLK